MAKSPISQRPTEKSFRERALGLPAAQFFSFKFINMALGHENKSRIRKISQVILEKFVKEKPDITVQEVLSSVTDEKRREILLQIGDGKTMSRQFFDQFCKKFELNEFLAQTSMTENGHVLSQDATSLLAELKKE